MLVYRDQPIKNRRTGMKTIVPIYICNFQTVQNSAASIHLSHGSSEQYGIKEIHVVNKKKLIISLEKNAELLGAQSWLWNPVDFN